jgi:hypothetical protein
MSYICNKNWCQQLHKTIVIKLNKLLFLRLILGIFVRGGFVPCFCVTNKDLFYIKARNNNIRQ